MSELTTFPIETHDSTYSSSQFDSAISNAMNMFNLIYPVGSIYMSTVNTNPLSLFGGTWEQIKDKFLLASGDTYSAGSTGGEATHTLTIDEMPVHAHNYTRASQISGTDWVGGSGTATKAAAITETKGNGVAHNNMPPYLTVYIWKRVS